MGVLTQHGLALPALQTRCRRAYYQYRLAPRPIGGSAKRVFDVVAASLALLALSLPLIAVALLIRLESPGPALFRQQRTGFRGRAFRILKFRTMTQMDDGCRIVQARADDPRVTPLGRFLRHTSIDELPQLINVVRGEMSLVGPRPHAVAHDSAFFGVNSEYPRRFLARPGMTGAAQVRGARGLTDTQEKVELRLRHDLHYVDSWSFASDIRILFATVLVLITAKNAC